jgi:hypothetical protein
MTEDGFIDWRDAVEEEEAEEAEEEEVEEEEADGTDAPVMCGVELPLL